MEQTEISPLVSMITQVSYLLHLPYKFSKAFEFCLSSWRLRGNISSFGFGNIFNCGKTMAVSAWCSSFGVRHSWV
jgi:hypothetical protein